MDNMQVDGDLPQNLLEEAFPPDTDANVIRGVAEGVLLADSTLESASFLNSLVGQDLRGHIRRAGILYRLHELITSGDLPFSCTMTKMARGNWHWVEVKSKNFVSHICRTEGPEIFPVDTPTRQDDRLTNQGDLFKTTPAVVPIQGYRSWLMFGAIDSGELSHLCWGMPKAKEDTWLARINILRRPRDGEVAIAVTPPTKPSGLRFKDHIEEALKNKGGEHGEKPA